ncbi:MEDS domain-containing protein [Kribbella sp. NPDC059898]|uniref:MEDS domain-containing protein n=1 Tax=Kribbella sp. NPDC059898 TaxID=3346995 RepID=UPI00365C3A98
MQRERAPETGAPRHVCWQYDSPDEFQAKARAFLAEGLSRTYRALYVADNPEQLQADSMIQVAGCEDFLPSGPQFDPEKALGAFNLATEKAMAEGFAGLSVAVDCTTLALDALESLARFEYLLGEYVATHPLSALCGYNRSRLDGERTAQVVCLHSDSNVDGPGFRLHAGDCRTLVLSGQLDLFSADLLALTLRRAALEPQNGELVVDASALTFLDHNTLLRLAEYAQSLRSVLVLRTSWPGAAQLARLLDVSGVRVEPAP